MYFRNNFVYVTQNKMAVFQLKNDFSFPPAHLSEPDGLLAVGGDLSLERLKLAYSQGIFPWFSGEEPILWWSPQPRFVLFPDELHVSNTMRQMLKKGIFKITYNQCFDKVVDNCSKIMRKDQDGTWITSGMKAAFIDFHEAGYAQSVEVWQDGELVGGLYGVGMGSCFFGESMFAKVSNASKAGFITFVNEFTKKGLELVDCQVHTPHLESLGAKMIDRDMFLALIKPRILKTAPFKSYF